MDLVAVCKRVVAWLLLCVEAHFFARADEVNESLFQVFLYGVFKLPRLGEKSS